MAATLTKTMDGLKSEQEASRPLHRRITSAEVNLKAETRLVNELGSEVHDLELQIKELGPTWTTRANANSWRKRV